MRATTVDRRREGVGEGMEGRDDIRREARSKEPRRRV